MNTLFLKKMLDISFPVYVIICHILMGDDLAVSYLIFST